MANPPIPPTAIPFHSPWSRTATAKPVTPITTRAVPLRCEASTIPTPVAAVNSGWANGETTARTTNVATRPPLPPSVTAVPRYSTFSVKAKPMPTRPAYTKPSTRPSRARRPTSRTASRPRPLNPSSTSGATSTAPTMSASPPSACTARVGGRLNSSEKAVATAAPQPKANSSRPRGSGSCRSSQPYTHTSGSTGREAASRAVQNAPTPTLSSTTTVTTTAHTAMSRAPSTDSATWPVRPPRPGCRAGTGSGWGCTMSAG